MKYFLVWIISFCLSLAAGYQFLLMADSQVPRHHGEEFAGDTELLFLGLTYYITYFSACLIFATKYSHSPKIKYIIILLCFFGVTSLIGFLFCKIIFAEYNFLY